MHYLSMKRTNNRLMILYYNEDKKLRKLKRLICS